MTTKEYKKYLLEYTHEGSNWCINVHATSFEDAKARAQAIYYARVLGTVEAEIPAYTGVRWFVRVFTWMRNWLHA